MRRILSIFFGVCVFFASPAVALERIQIRGLVEAALQNSPKLQAVRSRLRQQQVEADIVGDGRWPTLSGLVEQTSGSESRQQFRISQTVYDWGITSDKIDLADIEASQVELELERVQEEEIEALTGLILEWSSASERIKVLQAHLRRLKELQRLTSLRVGNVIDRGELSRVTAAIAGTEIELTVAHSTLEEALEQIQERVGRTLSLKHSAIPLLFDRWFADGISMSQMSRVIPAAPAVREAELGILKAEIEKKLARSEWRPRVSLDAIAERSEDRFGADTDQRVALRIESPIFQGLSAFKRPKAAEYALAAAVKERDLSLTQVRRTLQRLTSALRLQARRAPLIEQQLQASWETVELYTQQFRIGRRDMSDLIGAETERLSAELSALDLQVEQQTITLRLSSILGLLAKKVLKADEGTS